MIRLVFIAAILVLLYLLFRRLFPVSDYKRCGKCHGKGYWLTIRGEKDKCDVCEGSGRVER